MLKVKISEIFFTCTPNILLHNSMVKRMCPKMFVFEHLVHAIQMIFLECFNYNYSPQNFGIQLIYLFIKIKGPKNDICM